MAGMTTTDEMFDLRMSQEARPLLEKVKAFVETEVDPMSEEFARLAEAHENRWAWAPGQLELLDATKAKAKQQGLWNFFLPDEETGKGLSNLDYAYIAAELGKNSLAPECLNCSAPDTGNMEVLALTGTEEQKQRWLEPLLNGEIRSAYVMTEPDVASSDATNLECRAELDGDEWVINGEKHWITSAGDPRCKIMIVMVRTADEGPRHECHSQILVPTNTPGFDVLEPLSVFGYDHAPTGHMHVRFDNCRVPRENVLLGAGRGFEISQIRLGPGRIHHCMRSLGTAERAIELMVKRGLARKAFGKDLARLGKNTEQIANARIEIESMRRMVLTAARAMDVLGNAEARVWVSAVKAMVPERTAAIIDQAIQIHGAAGLCQWTPLAAAYADQRWLRFADGPDEVHRFVVGRAEIARWEEDDGAAYDPKVTYLARKRSGVRSYGGST